MKGKLTYTGIVIMLLSPFIETWFGPEEIEQIAGVLVLIGGSIVAWHGRRRIQEAEYR